MKNPISIYNTDGFTLIEAIIAMVVLVIGIFSMYSMQVSALQGNNRANHITEASTWASDRIEDITNLAYDDLLDKDGDGTGQDADNDGVDNNGGDFGLPDATTATADFSETSPDNLYTIFWNVADNHPMENLKTLRIIVQYKAWGQSRKVTMDYIKASM